MFCIKPKNPGDWYHAMLILTQYSVACVPLANSEDPNTMHMSVREDIPLFGETDGVEEQEQLRLAEMAFQMSWHQVGKVCPYCEGEVETCGHLTFNKPINPAF